LTTKIDAIKIEHDRDLTTFVAEKEKIRKDYENQIYTLTGQKEEAKIRNESSETLNKEAIELIDKLLSS
jgi:hypothetical protein